MSWYTFLARTKLCQRTAAGFDIGSKNDKCHRAKKRWENHLNFVNHPTIFCIMSSNKYSKQMFQIPPAPKFLEQKLGAETHATFVVPMRSWGLCTSTTSVRTYSLCPSAPWVRNASKVQKIDGFKIQNYKNVGMEVP